MERTDQHILLRWSYISTFSTMTMQMLASVTLTRFLQPADYGLAAMAILCSGFAGYLTQLGVSRALVQKPNLSARNIRAAYTLSLATGIAGCLILIALSPLLARYFREPRLTPIIMAFAVSLFFQSVSGVAGGLLRRELRLRSLALCDFFAYAISTFALGLPMAIKGYGVWALVVSTTSQTFFSACFYFISRRHSLLPVFKRADYENLTGFSFKASATTLIEAFGGNLDTLLLGRLVSPAQLGFYNRSLTLSTMPAFNISNGLTRVFYPTIAREAELGKQRCIVVLKAAQTQMIALIAAACCGAGLIAPTLVPAMFGRQWTPAIPVFRVLCAVAVIDASFHLPGIQLEVYALFRWKMVLQGVFAVVFGISIYFMAPHGIAWVAAAYAVLQLCRSLGLNALSARSLGTSAANLLASCLPGFCCAGLLAFALLPAQRWLLVHTSLPIGIRLVILIAMGAALTAFAWFGLFRQSIFNPWLALFKRKAKADDIVVPEPVQEAL